MQYGIVCSWPGQVHSDVDGDTVWSVRVACHCPAVRRLRTGHGTYGGHVGTDRVRLHLLPLPRLLLPLHLLRCEYRSSRLAQ